MVWRRTQTEKSLKKGFLPVFLEHSEKGKKEKYKKEGGKVG